MMTPGTMVCVPGSGGAADNDAGSG
jgi:hypothetical protein